MTEMNKKIPETELDSSTQGIFQTVKRPLVVYLMALWSFFGISSFLTTVLGVLSQGNEEIRNVGFLVVLVVSIIFIVYILQMRRYFLIAFGVLSVILALWQSINLVAVLLSGQSHNPIIIFLLLYIVPSVFLATLALRPKFLDLADNYRKFKHFESMRKASLKGMRR